MCRNKRGAWLLVSILCCGIGYTQETFIAYEVPVNTVGNQGNFGGALGMDFDVLREITVTRLGAFDDASDGLALTITARLWDRASATELASVVFSPGDDGELVGGSRFKALDTPLVLPFGFQGSIAAEGYGAGEMVANSGGVPPLPGTTNDGGICALDFVGTSRWGDVGAFPANPDGGPANRYAAGTFEYEVDPPPENPVAYVIDAGTAGNQEFGGPLGMDFDVLESIDITALGVFDDGSDGLNLTITARLYNRATQEELASLEFTPGDPGALVDGSRLKDLAELLTVPGGFQGTIVAEGYGAGESVLNAGAHEFSSPDNGGCLIAFVGSGRWDLPGASFPANVDTGPPNRYGAGTFRFRKAQLVIPPPTDVVATADEGRVGLSWTAPAGGPAIAGYNIYQTRPGARLKVNPVPVTDTQFTAAGLLNGVEHCFVVKSVNDTGLESDDSNEACATPITDIVPPSLFISHQVPSGTEGNQPFGGSLGMDFLVNTEIIIVRLGVFDDQSDGLHRAITARLYDLDRQAELASVEFTPEDAGEPVGGSLFKSLPAPIELPAGFRGTIVAEGYGDDDPATEEVDERELNGNQSVGLLALTTDSADCSIAFTGSRFGEAGVFPGSFNVAPVSDAFAAGTFEYGPVGPAAPGPEAGIAYVVPEGATGIQPFGGSLGMDFNVLDDLQVTRLGVFDHGSDGLGLPLTARLFNRDSQLELASIQFTPEDPGELVGGSRFKDLAEAVCLPAGFRGVIAAEGYGVGELLANGGAIPIVWSTDDGNCLLEFVGGGRFGNPGVFPVDVDVGPENRYAAGTFAFELPVEACILPPDPPTELSVTAGDGKVTLSWNAVEGVTPAASYKIFRSTGGGPFEEIVEVDVTEYTDLDLANGVEVCYRVRSVSAEGREGEDDSRVICATPGATVPGRIIAYEVPGGTVGNNAGADTAYGLDFDVEQRIRIHRLGVFDDGTDGLTNILSVSLHNRDNGVELIGVEFSSADPGVLIGGSRFKDLPQPQVLPAGFHGSVVAAGFSEQERLHLGGNFPTHPGPCSLTFVNSRSGPAGSFFDLVVSPTVSIHGPAAGTFEFEPVDFPDPGAGGIAYEVPAGTIGNQNFGGALGMDFDVRSTILIRSLGVFDDGSDGLNLPINARLYNRDTREVLVSMDFTPEDQGDLVGGSRFKPLEEPLELQPGFRGSMVASGYGATELLGNQGGVDLGLTTNDGGCLISFVNGGRYGDPADPGAFPDVPDGGPANRYAAGTFEYGPPSRQVPGDCNQDGALDISDAVCIFGVLFLGDPAVFPCGDGSPADTGNVSLLDFQPDGGVDLSDGIAALQFLFLGGPAHALAVEGNEIAGCVVTPGCPDNDRCP